MNYISRIATLIRRSFNDPELYTEATSSRIPKPLSVLSWISVVWALMIAIPAGIALILFVNTNFLDTASGIYPSELVVTIKDGEASANVAQPYFIDMPGKESASTSPQYLAVIDTRPEVTVAELTSYDAPVILTQKTLFVADEAEAENLKDVPNPTGSFRPVDLSEVKDFTLDKAMVTSFIEKIRPFVNGFLYVLPVLLFFLITGFSVVAYLFVALFAALIVMLIAKFKGLSYDYGTSYVLALFALIPVALVDLLTDVLGFGNYFLLSLAVFVAIIVYNVRPSASAETVSQNL